MISPFSNSMVSSFANSAIARLPVGFDDQLIRHPFAEEIADVSDLLRRADRGEVVYAKSVTHTPESSRFLGLDELAFTLGDRHPHKRPLLTDTDKTERWNSRLRPLAGRDESLPKHAIHAGPACAPHQPQETFIGTRITVSIVPHDFNPAKAAQESVSSLRTRLRRVIGENRSLQARLAERDAIIETLTRGEAA